MTNTFAVFVCLFVLNKDFRIRKYISWFQQNFFTNSFRTFSFKKARNAHKRRHLVGEQLKWVVRWGVSPRLPRSFPFPSRPSVTGLRSACALVRSSVEEAAILAIQSNSAWSILQVWASEMVVRNSHSRWEPIAESKLLLTSTQNIYFSHCNDINLKFQF